MPVKHSGLGISKRFARVSGLVLFLVCAPMAMAQLDTGTISGTVTDQTRAALPGAALTIKNVATGISRTLATNEAGRYDAAALPLGTYEVTASLAGFRPYVSSGIVLTVGRNAVVDRSLQVGDVARAVIVT